MKDTDKTKEQLIEELEALRRQVTELKEVETKRKRAEEAVRKIQDELEIRVKARTVELSRANAILEEQIPERKRVEEKLRRQNEYLTTLHETTLGLMNRLELAGLLESIVGRAGILLGTPHGYIRLIEPGETDMVVKVGTGAFSNFVGQRRKPTEGLSGKVLQTGQPFAIEDYRIWQDRLPDPIFNTFRAVAGVPLKSDLQVVGVLGLAYLEEGQTFGDDEISLLGRFAELASIALDNARLYHAVQQELAERKQAEEAIRESEARAAKAQVQLLDAIEGLTEAFALYDSEDRLVLCNSKYREFYDLSTDLLMPGARFEDNIRISAYRGQIADAIGREEEWVRERLAQHQDPQGTYLQKLRNGRWLKISERKTKEGGIVGVRTDITELKQVE
ncbi:MAG: PAS-domain containing protein, partial [Nitrososphaera sp.]|nr:PAS-domain containing protein [Nitrososphaera sp.]